MKYIFIPPIFLKVALWGPEGVERSRCERDEDVVRGMAEGGSCEGALRGCARARAHASGAGTISTTVCSSNLRSIVCECVFHDIQLSAGWLLGSDAKRYVHEGCHEGFQFGLTLERRRCKELCSSCDSFPKTIQNRQTFKATSHTTAGKEKW